LSRPSIRREPCAVHLHEPDRAAGPCRKRSWSRRPFRGRLDAEDFSLAGSVTYRYPPNPLPSHPLTFSGAFAARARILPQQSADAATLCWRAAKFFALPAASPHAPNAPSRTLHSSCVAQRAHDSHRWRTLMARTRARVSTICTNESPATIGEFSDSIHDAAIDCDACRSASSFTGFLHEYR